MKPRRVLFWSHLAAGISAGTVVSVMAATGVALSVQKPVLAFAERGLRAATPSPALPRLSLDALVARARSAAPGAEPDAATLSADPAAPVAIGFGRERTVFLNPYDGSALGEGAAGLRRFFQGAEEWHRWLAVPGKRRPLGRAVTGASNAAFLFLAVSGLFLWRPRRWTRAALRASLLPSWKGHGKARDWTWHNAVGVWSAPVLLIVTATGVVISYPWANDLLYRAVGETPPARRQGAGERPEEKVSAPSWEALASSARALAPRWRTISLRAPAGAGRATAQIEEDGPVAYERSSATLDAATGAVLKWEPASGWSRGRRLRALARFSHTGEAGGPAGRLLAALASSGALVLAWTGWTLAWRRFRGRGT